MRSRVDEQTTIPAIIEFLKTCTHGASIQEIAQGLDMNRNLVAKYLAILHMQGRLDLRAYGNIKIYRLANKIPFQSLALLLEDITLGIDKSHVIRSYHGCGEEIFGLRNEQFLGKHIIDIPGSPLFFPEIQDHIRSILDGVVNFREEEECHIRGLPVRIRLVACIFDDGSSGVAFLCSKIRLSKNQSYEYDRLLSHHTSLLDEMHEFFVELSSDWEIIAINSSLSKYCGKPPIDCIGTRGIPLVSSQDLEFIQNSINTSKEKKSDKFQVRVVLEDGTVQWQEWVFYIQERSGEKTGYRGYGLDITERKLHESKIEMYQSGVEMLLHQKTEELREIAGQLRKEINERKVLERELIQREERYRNLTESTSDIVWEIDADKKIIFVNDRVRSLLGYEPEEIIGNSPLTYISDDELSQIRGKFHDSRSHKTPIETVRLRIIRKDENYAWIELSGVPIFKSDGSFQGYRGIGRDITAKMIAEIEQQHLLSIIDSTPDLIAMADPEGNLIYMNRAGRSILKIPDDIDISTMKNFSMYAPESLELVQIGRVTAFKEGFWMGDTILVAMDGSHVPVSQVILSHQALPRQMPILSTIARDISHRLQVEQELAHAYAYNRNLIEVSPDPLVTIGPDGKIQDVNQATEIATGYSRDHLIGTSFSSYFSKPDSAEIGYQKVFSKGVVRDYPLEMLHKDGQTLSVLYNAVLYRDEEGVVKGIFAAARDITDIRRYQNMMSQSLSFYLNVLDKFPNPIWRSGVDAKCDYFNKAWLDFTGRAIEDEIGDGWVSGIHPDDTDRCVSEYLKSFAKREPFCLMYRLHHSDGSYHWITDFGSPLFNPDNEFIGYIGSCYDIDKYLLETDQLSKIIKNHSE